MLCSLFSFSPPFLTQVVLSMADTQRCQISSADDERMLSRIQTNPGCQVFSVIPQSLLHYDVTLPYPPLMTRGHLTEFRRI
mmetsp:Transcript_22252/g.58946  ORF Transcript_22252/g.58946 Transcript_22252/m.58946 type:complete len:81 (-) Transcript_22252:99-341(-)